MKEKIKKPHRIYFSYPIIIIIFIISFIIFEGIFSQNNAFAIDSGLSGLKYKSGCVPLNEPDPETGCRACGDNARTDYEQCRQVYYLKKQTEILESQQNSKNTSIEELEAKNQELQQLLENQNKQIDGLIQGLGQQNERINALTVSLKNANFLNISLSLILAGVLVYLVLILIRKKWKK